MKRAICLALLLAAPAGASTATSAATAWLSSHKSPTDDQLGELAKANPAAFSIVSALLKKHTSGGPTLTAAEKGPDVFRKMMGTSHFHAEEAAAPAEMPYAAESPHAAIGDQLTYNPNAKADKDAKMVDSLLDAVRGLTGKKAKKIGLLNKHFEKKKEEDPFAKDMALFADDAPAPQASVQVSLAKVQQTMNEQDATPAPAPHKKHNSYLEGLDLSGDMPVATRHSSLAAEHSSVQHADFSSGDLASFSFGDNAPQKPKPKPVVKAKPKKENAFLKWLSHTNKAPTPQAEVVQAAPEAPKKKVNPYLAGLFQ